MKKISMYTVVTVAVIAAGTAFVAHSLFNNDGEGLIGGLVNRTAETAAVVADVPEKVITGEPMGRDEEPGVLGRAVTGTGRVAARVGDVPQDVAQGNYRRDRRYEEEGDSLETEMETDGDIEDVDAPIFPDVEEEEGETAD